MGDSFVRLVRSLALMEFRFRSILNSCRLAFSRRKDIFCELCTERLPADHLAANWVAAADGEAVWPILKSWLDALGNQAAACKRVTSKGSTPDGLTIENLEAVTLIANTWAEQQLLQPGLQVHRLWGSFQMLPMVHYPKKSQSKAAHFSVPCRVSQSRSLGDSNWSADGRKSSAGE